MKLFPYQDEGAVFLANRKRALLADTMGLGKTAQAIVACDWVQAKRVLVLCPASVRINWQREFHRFSSYTRTYSVIFGRRDKPAAGEEGVTICSYEMATNPVMLAQLMKMQFDVLILDESHFLKNRAAKRTIAVLGQHCKGETGLISRAEYCWALTGTPCPNHPGEIFSLLRAFGIWKDNYYAFEGKFCQTKPNAYNGTTVVGMKNVGELRALSQPIMLRRKAEEVLKDLPNITYSHVVLSLDSITHPEDLANFREAEQTPDGKLLASLLQRLQSEDPAVVDAAAAELSSLHLPTLRRLTGMAKIRPIYEYVSRELDNGLDKIVLFGIHRDVLMGLRDEFARHKYNPVLVFGGSDAATKQQRIDSFVEKWQHRVFLGQIQAAGTGIDGLQKSCAQVDFAEASWNPMENAQAVGRVRRYGQTRHVRSRFFSLADSLDEAIMNVIQRKTAMISQLLD